MNAERFTGKRFALAILCVIALTGAFIVSGDNADATTKFGSFALYLAGIYGAYCTGQSATDYVKERNGGANV